MKGTLILADAANNDSQGKLAVIGGCWNSAKAGRIRATLVVLLKFEAVAEIGKHEFAAVLTDESQRQEVIQELRGAFEIQAAQPLSVDELLPRPGYALNVPEMELGAGSYRWALSVDGEEMDDWRFQLTPREEHSVK